MRRRTIQEREHDARCTEPPASSEQPSIPDEEFERLVREAESGNGDSMPKEPSARQRMVTERLRQRDEDAARAKGRSGGLLRRRARRLRLPRRGSPRGGVPGPPGRR